MEDEQLLGGVLQLITQNVSCSIFKQYEWRWQEIKTEESGRSRELPVLSSTCKNHGSYSFHLYNRQEVEQTK